MKLQLLALLFIVFSSTLKAQEAYTFTDARDGTTYNAIKFKIPLEGGVSIEREWMVENMNFDTGEGSFCYKAEPAYCDKFGKLYTFDAAAKACPDGWRIPTRKDWFLLFSVYGGASKAGIELMEGGKSGMKLLLGGFGYGKGYYTSVGAEGNYWDSFESGESADGIITFSRANSDIKFGGIGKKMENSARCIKIHR